MTEKTVPTFTWATDVVVAKMFAQTGDVFKAATDEMLANLQQTHRDALEAHMTDGAAISVSITVVKL